MKPGLRAIVGLIVVSALFRLTGSPRRTHPPIDPIEHSNEATDKEDWLRQRLGIQDDAAHAQHVTSEWQALIRDVRIRRLGFLAGITWEQLGPAPLNLNGANILHGPFSGRLTSVSANPRDQQMILAGSDGGGIWRSADGGSSWQPTADRECSSYVTAVTFDPANPNIAYAGARCGLLRSLDTGLSWARIGSVTPRPSTGDGLLTSVQAMALDVDTAGSTGGAILLLATLSGLHRSTDSGATATRISIGNFNAFWAVRQSPTQRNRFYAVSNTGSTSVVFRSDDKGLTWRQLTADIGLALRLSLSARDGESLYVTHRRPGESTYQIAITNDGGSTWSSVDGPASETGGGGRADIVPLAGTVPMLFHGVGYWLRRGNEWVRVSASNLHADGHWVDMLSESEFLLANDGGLSKGTLLNSGVTWKSAVGDLSTFQIYPGVSIEPGDPESILIGTQDNGTLLRRDGRWQRIQGADGGWTAFDRDNSNTLYGEEQRPYGSFSCTRAVSTSCGSPSATGLDFSQSSFLPPMVRSDSGPRTLYYATSQVYRSIDGGRNWSALSEHFPSRPTAGCPAQPAARTTITTLAVRPGDPETIVAGTRSGSIWRSSNGGATWSQTNAPSCYAVNDIYVDRFTGFMFAAYARPTTYVATARDFGLVLRSTDNGATWQNIGGELPNLAAIAVAYDPDRRLLFIGNELGVYVGDTDGKQVSPLTGGMPVVTVQDLVFDHDRRYLFAATWGRGIYRLSLPR